MTKAEAAQKLIELSGMEIEYDRVSLGPLLVHASRAAVGRDLAVFEVACEALFGRSDFADSSTQLFVARATGAITPVSQESPEATTGTHPSDGPDPAIWSCKVGSIARGELPEGADSPMRKAVEEAYTGLTGWEPDYVISGWGGNLTADEQDSLYTIERPGE